MARTSRHLKRVLADHRALHKALDGLTAYLEAPRPGVTSARASGWAKGLTRRLHGLVVLLERHFKEEESPGGFYAGIVEQFPRAQRRVERLCAEHARTLADVGAILAAARSYAQGRPPADPRLRTWLRSVLARLRRHETAERKLLGLYYEDIGSID